MFSVQGLSMILDNTSTQNSCLIIILSYVVQLEKYIQPMKIPTHEFFNHSIKSILQEPS